MLKPLTIAFLLFALPTALMLALLTPLGQVPDEPAHIARADALLHGQIVGHRDTVTGPNGTQIVVSGVTANVLLLSAAGSMKTVDYPPNTVTRAVYEKARSFVWLDRRDFLDVGSIALYLPVLYVPGAIGIAVTRHFGGGPADAIIGGRVATLLVFLALGVLALQIARRGRALMFCALTCPMTLGLAGSMSEDGLLIVSGVLVSALVSRGRESDRRIAACIVACIGMIKLPYAALAVLLLGPLPPIGTWRARRRDLSRRLGLVGLALLPGLLWTGAMMAFIARPSGRVAYHPGPLWPGDPSRIFDGTDPVAQLSVLMAAPIRFIILPIESLLNDEWILRQAIGVLGWLNMVLPHFVYSFWYVALPLAVLADITHTGQRGPGWMESLIYAAAAVAGVWAIMMSQYLTWSNVGIDHIEGFQGRYLLPLAGLLALSPPRLPLPGGRFISAACKLGPMAAAACGLVVLPPLIVSTYYLH